MFAILHALGMFVANLLKSRSRLEAENLLLRHQLTIAMRQAPPRPTRRSRAFTVNISVSSDAPPCLHLSIAHGGVLSNSADRV